MTSSLFRSNSLLLVILTTVLAGACASVADPAAGADLWSSVAFEDIFLWNSDFNTTSSPVNGTCHTLCDGVYQTFKDCTAANLTSSPSSQSSNLSAAASTCLCSESTGTDLGTCVSCIAAETDSKLLNLTAQYGLEQWTVGCRTAGHNVSLPAVNTSSGLALLTGANNTTNAGRSPRLAGNAWIPPAAPLMMLLFHVLT